MNIFTLSLVLFLFASVNCIKAQLQIKAELRPRGEMRNGYKQLPDTIDLSAFFVSQRSRLSLGFTQKKYALYISIQDVRVWGDELNYSATGIRGDNASIDLKEAWCKFLFSDQFSLKVGRQEFKYADQRLIGGRNWNQHGMSYDAVLIRYKGDFSCDLGLSYNNNAELVYQELFSPDKMKTLNFVFLQKKWNETFSSSFMYVLSGFQHPDKAEKIALKNTPGILLNYNPSPFKFSGSGYYQFGHNSGNETVSAYFWNLRSEISSAHSFLACGIDYFSGQNFASTDSNYLKTDHMFDILYGARHRYYGHMDYFSNPVKGTAGGGLIDVYLDTRLDIGSNMFLQATYHNFMLENNVLDTESGSTLDKTLANEIDFTFSYKLSNDIKIDMGYAFIISTESLNKIQNVSSHAPKDAHWIWLMCTVTPTYSLDKQSEN